MALVWRPTVNSFSARARRDDAPSRIAEQDSPFNRQGPDRDDRSRFARLVLPHLDAAYELACWITASPADAADVTQDACLRALRSFAEADEHDGRLRVLTIVRKAAHVWLRDNPAADVLLIDPQGNDMARDKPEPQNRTTPETHGIRVISPSAAHAAIAALPVLYREAMVLRDLQGLSYREMAEITQAPIAIVMSRLAQARDALIAALTHGTGVT
jgi:RNA polymerase sigma factor (sigma-70 family)